MADKGHAIKELVVCRMLGLVTIILSIANGANFIIYIFLQKRREKFQVFPRDHTLPEYLEYQFQHEQYKTREGGDIGLYIKLVPKVLY